MGWFRDDSSALHLLCTLFLYDYFSSIADDQALDSGDWGPANCLVCLEQSLDWVCSHRVLGLSRGTVEDGWGNREAGDTFFLLKPW